MILIKNKVNITLIILLILTSLSCDEKVIQDRYIKQNYVASDFVRSDSQKNLYFVENRTAYIEKINIYGDKIWKVVVDGEIIFFEIDINDKLYILTKKYGDIHGGIEYTSSLMKLDINGKEIFNKDMGRLYRAFLGEDDHIYILKEIEDDKRVFSKLGKNGEVILSKTFNSDEKFSIAKITEDGFIYLGSDNCSAFLKNCMYDDDIALTKYDKDFNLIWHKKWGGKGWSTTIKQILFDEEATKQVIYVGGETTGDFDGYIGNKGNHCEARSCTDAFVTKFTEDGEKLWTKMWGEKDQYDRADHTFILHKGNFYMMGYYNYYSPVEYLNDGIQYDEAIKLYKLNKDLEFVFAKSWSMIKSKSSYFKIRYDDMIIDKDDNVYIVGATTGSLDGKEKSSSSYEGYLIKYKLSDEDLKK